MYHHQQEELAKNITTNIMALKTITKASIAKMVKETVEEYFERIFESGVWTLDDIIDQAKDMGYECDEETAKDIMGSIDHNFDASIGISWDTINVYLDDYTDKMKKLESTKEE